MTAQDGFVYRFGLDSDGTSEASDDAVARAACASGIRPVPAAACTKTTPPVVVWQSSVLPQ